jgi:hypothetical protein
MIIIVLDQKIIGLMWSKVLTISNSVGFVRTSSNSFNRAFIIESCIIYLVFLTTSINKIA